MQSKTYAAQRRLKDAEARLQTETAELNKRAKAEEWDGDKLKTEIRRTETRNKREISELGREVSRLQRSKKFLHKDEEQTKAGLALGEEFPELVQMFDHWNHIRGNALDILVESGLYNRDQADELMAAESYVPLFRESQLEDGRGPQQFINRMQVRANKKFRGSENQANDIFENIELWMLSEMGRAIHNKQGVQLARAAVEYGQAKEVKTGGQNIARLYVNGEPRHYSMRDALFMNAFKGIEGSAIPAWKFATKATNLLRKSIVLNPLFSITQIPQDSFEAMFTSGLKPRYAMWIPFRAVKNMLQTALGTSKTHEELKKWGSVGRPDWSDAANKHDDTLTATYLGEDKRSWWAKFVKKLEGFSMAADNSVRQAVYELGQEQGVDPALLVEKTFEIINFRREGSASLVRLAGQLIPFFNAYLQAMNVAWKTLTMKGITPLQKEEAWNNFIMLAGTTFALSWILVMMNADDERYIEEDPKTRDRRIVIPGLTPESSSVLLGIPLRKGLFLLPKTIAEHVALLYMEKGGEDPAATRAAIFDTLMSGITGPSLAPQFVKAPIEIALNRNFWTGRAIEGTYQMGLDKEERFTGRTSDLARLASNAAKSFADSTGLNVLRSSPLMIDHLIHGMLGTSGHILTSMTSELLQVGFVRDLTGLPTRPGTFGTRSFWEGVAAIPGISGYVKTASPVEARATTGRYYELQEIIMQAANTLRRKEDTDPASAFEYLSENMEKFQYKGLIEGLQPVITDLRNMMNTVRDDNTGRFSPQEKHDYINMIKRRMTQLMRMSRGLIREARKATM